MRFGRFILTCGGLVALLTCGCAEYATPSCGADLSAVGYDKSNPPSGADISIAATLAKRPLAQFPASIAVVRIESPGYTSQNDRGWGQGRYSVLASRDIEDPTILDKLQKMPQVAGIALINRMLLPNQLESDRELRQAAAQLHADMLLIYTVDTQFRQNDLAAPLTLVTLGLAPDQTIHVDSTVSAVLMDTRNGYIYGVCEGTDHRDGLTIGWTTQAAVDSARVDTEKGAFKNMANDLPALWTAVVKQHEIAVKASAVQ